MPDEGDLLPLLDGQVQPPQDLGRLPRRVAELGGVEVYVALDLVQPEAGGRVGVDLGLAVDDAEDLLGSLEGLVHVHQALCE